MSFIILGHRGMGPTARIDDLPEDFTPENTLQSFKEALDLGADGLEFDVQITSDGELAVIHTDQLKKFAKEQEVPVENADTLSSKFNMSSLANYDVGNDQNVPTLREVLDFIVERNAEHRLKTGKDIIINIELKGDNTATPTFEVISEYINDGRLQKDDFLFNSFEWDRLKELRSHDEDLKIMPAIKTVALFGKENVQIPGWKVKDGAEYQEEGLAKLKAFHEDCNAHAVDCIVFDLRPGLIDFAEENGVGLFTSTSNENMSASNIQGSLSHMVDASTRLKFTGFRADNVEETRAMVTAIRATKGLEKSGRLGPGDVVFEDRVKRVISDDKAQDHTLPPQDDGTDLARGVDAKKAWETIIIPPKDIIKSTGPISEEDIPRPQLPGAANDDEFGPEGDEHLVIEDDGFDHS